MSILSSESSPEQNAPSNELSRLRLVMDATLEGWWEWDITANTTYHSPQWYKMLGHKMEDWSSTYNMWVELMHPDDVKFIPDLQSEKIRIGKPWELEFRMRCADGNYKWILSRGNIVRWSPEGVAEKVVGIHIDLTERKELELLKELYEKKEELLNGIIRISPAAFNVYDFIKKRIICSSHFGAKILKYTKEEFEQLSDDFIEQLVHPDDISKVTDHTNALITTDQNQILECVFRLKNKEGKYVWVKTMDSVSKRDEEGRVIQVIGAVYDAQNLVEMEIKIEENIKFLEEIAFENSHMVRGPVSSILGLMTLVKKSYVQSDIDKQLIEYMERTVIQMDKVIRTFSDTIDQQIRNKKK